MKTRRISAILACIMLVSLTACANDGPSKTPDESTAQTTEAQTTENVTTEEITEEAAESAATLAFNEDLFSDIGLTYPQLVEKRGKKVDAVGRDGVDFYFENGYGAYTWGYGDLDYGRELTQGEGYPVPRDENHNIIAEDVQLPKEDLACNYIRTKVKDLFSNATFSLKLSDIENIDGVQHCHRGNDGIVTSFKYYFNLKYNNVEISIYHDDPETIEADSPVFIRVISN